MITGTTNSWAEKVVFVMGDIMLDRFVYGNVERISPEAPIPVLHFQREEIMLGGAANVARNVVALGGKAILAGVVGNDSAGILIIEKLLEREGIKSEIVKSTKGKTIEKTRFSSGSQQIMRLDIEEKIEMDNFLEDRLTDSLQKNSRKINALIISDYAKGTLSKKLIKSAINIAIHNKIPVIVDPKTSDVSKFQGATVITPNSLEASIITGQKCNSDATAAEAAKEIKRLAGVDSVVVTRGQHGMTILDSAELKNEARHVSAQAREVFDVSGAGDTVVATLALALTSGMPVIEAAKVANYAAGVSVAKRGTSVVYPHEIKRAMGTNHLIQDPKIVERYEAQQIVASWKKEGLRVGFTNGCYDLVHPGHIKLLKNAKDACDRLIVALNTDDSVKRLKGPTRPVQNQAARATVMASIGSVDLVTLFSEDTPLELIEALTPDVLIKGADYTIDQVVGGQHVIKNGGEVVLIPTEQGQSTSSIIQRSRR